MIGIVLIGRSNSGKSTIGKIVAEKLNIRYISSGDIARSMNDSQIQEDLNSGKMAPEDKMRDMVLRKINSEDTPYILDGFPRFREQYEWLKQHTHHSIIYVNVYIPYGEALSRASLRNRCDDNSIEEKMKFYEEKTSTMLHDLMANGEVTYCINNYINDVDASINKLMNIVEDHLC